jgi:hypothetical protein
MWTFTCTNKQYGNGLVLLLSRALLLKSKTKAKAELIPYPTTVTGNILYYKQFLQFIV